jgi:hypothetical protein
MKNPKMSEAIFAFTNRYALAEEATLNTTEQKKEKDPSHSLAHPRAMKRRGKRIIPSMRWNGHEATSSTGPS